MSDPEDKPKVADHRDVQERLRHGRWDKRLEAARELRAKALAERENSHGDATEPETEETPQPKQRSKADRLPPLAGSTSETGQSAAILLENPILPHGPVQETTNAETDLIAPQRVVRHAPKRRRGRMIGAVLLIIGFAVAGLAGTYQFLPDTRPVFDEGRDQIVAFVQTSLARLETARAPEIDLPQPNVASDDAVELAPLDQFGAQFAATAGIDWLDDWVETAPLRVAPLGLPLMSDRVSRWQVNTVPPRESVSVESERSETTIQDIPPQIQDALVLASFGKPEVEDTQNAVLATPVSFEPASRDVPASMAGLPQQESAGQSRRSAAPVQVALLSDTGIDGQATGFDNLAVTLGDQPQTSDPSALPGALSTGHRQDTTPLLPISNEDAPATQTLPRQDSIRLYVLAPDATAPDAIATMEARAGSIGYELRPPGTVPFSIGQSQVRFYHAEDAEAAAVVAERLGVTQRDFTNYRPAPDPGTLELWMAGESLAERIEQDVEVSSQSAPAPLLPDAFQGFCFDGDPDDPDVRSVPIIDGRCQW